jgi:HPt (histidine-containing phosphotransfer) domain-containing protein
MSDLAANITATSLLVGAVATLIVALHKDKSSNGEAKAISVTRIDDTDQKVKTLIQQVDFLFDEVTKLRNQKYELEQVVAKLRDELRKKDTDHDKTKLLLKEALAQLKDKSDRLKALENAKDN